MEKRIEELEREREMLIKMVKDVTAEFENSKKPHTRKYPNSIKISFHEFLSQF